MSLNIDMKMILHVKFSGSHFNSHHLLNLLEDARCRESLEYLPLELHQLSNNSIQFAEMIVVRIPLDFAHPEFNKIISHLSQTEDRIGEDGSTVQQACRQPPQILELHQADANGFCLTTD